MFHTTHDAPHLIREEGAPVQSIAQIDVQGRRNGALTLVNAELDYTRRSERGGGLLKVRHVRLSEAAGHEVLLAVVPLADLQVLTASGGSVRYSGWLSGPLRFYPADMPFEEHHFATDGTINMSPPEVTSEHLASPAPVTLTLTTGTPHAMMIAWAVDDLAHKLRIYA